MRQLLRPKENHEEILYAAILVHLHSTSCISSHTLALASGARAAHRVPLRKTS